jgi:hypothetical protein
MSGGGIPTATQASSSFRSSTVILPAVASVIAASLAVTLTAIISIAGMPLRVVAVAIDRRRIACAVDWA